MGIRSLTDVLTEVMGVGAKARVADVAARAAGSPELAAKLNAAAQIMEDTGNKTPLLKLLASKEVGQWSATPARKAPQGTGRPPSRDPVSFEDRIAKNTTLRSGLEEIGVSTEGMTQEQVLEAAAEAFRNEGKRGRKAKIPQPVAPPPRQMELPLGDRTSQVLDRLQGPPTQYQPTAPEVISQQFDDIFRADVMPARPEGPGMSTLTYGQREAMNPPRAPQPSYDEMMEKARRNAESGGTRINNKLQGMVEEVEGIQQRSRPPGPFDGVEAEAPRDPNYELGSEDWMAMSGAADRSRPRRQTGNLRHQPERQLQDIAIQDDAARAAKAREPAPSYAREAAMGGSIAAGVGGGLYLMNQPQSASTGDEPPMMDDAPAIDSTGGTADLAAETSPPPMIGAEMVPDITASPEPFSAGTMDYGPSINFDYAGMARDKIRQANELQLQYGRQTPESLALIREADALYRRAAEERRAGFHPPIMPVDQQDAMTSAIRNRRAG